MTIHQDLNIRPRFVYVVWAAVYLFGLVWNFTTQPLGAWGPWVAYIVLVASLLTAFWDATKTRGASLLGLTAVLLAVLASSFNGDRAAATPAREHVWVLAIDLVLLVVMFGGLARLGSNWDKRYKESLKESSPTIDEMFLQITEALWER
jgi:hypothetical protein